MRGCNTPSGANFDRWPPAPRRPAPLPWPNAGCHRAPARPNPTRGRPAPAHRPL